MNGKQTAIAWVGLILVGIAIWHQRGHVSAILFNPPGGTPNSAGPQVFAPGTGPAPNATPGSGYTVNPSVPVPGQPQAPYNVVPVVP